MVPYSDYQLTEKQISIIKKSYAKLRIAEYIKENGTEPTDLKPFYSITSEEMEKGRRFLYVNELAKEPYEETPEGKVIEPYGYEGRLHFTLDWTGSQKRITVSETNEEPQPSNPNQGQRDKYIYFGNSVNFRLYETSQNVFEATIDFKSDWGFFVRTSTSTWDSGTRYGGRPDDYILYGFGIDGKAEQTIILVNNNQQDIHFQI